MELHELDAAKDVLDAHEDWRLYVDTFSAVDAESYEHGKLEDEKVYLKSSVEEGERLIKAIKSAVNQVEYTKAMNDFADFTLYITKRTKEFFKWLTPNAEAGVLKSTLDE